MGLARSLVAKDPIHLAETFLRTLMKAPGVAIDRDEFLKTELGKYYAPDVVRRMVASTPSVAGADPRIIDAIARKAINREVNRASAMSFVAGVPGGLAMLGTVPADITQYYAHVLRIEQKLAYLYGWKSFFNGPSDGPVDDETLGRLVLLLGVAAGVANANKVVAESAAVVVEKGLQQALQANVATRNALESVVEGILRQIGMELSRRGLGDSAAKVVPLLSGVVSGGLTYATFKPCARRLQNHLRTLPQARGYVEPLLTVASYGASR